MSARTHCPDCNGSFHVIDLQDLLHSSSVDYFRCSKCGAWWTVPKGTNGPARRGVHSESSEFTTVQKADREQHHE
jgi:hypothetical protein